MVIQLWKATPAYSTKIYDHSDYWLQLSADVESVRGHLTVCSPYITQQMLERWLPLLQRAVKRGVRVTVVLQRPWDWDKRELNVLPDHAQIRLNQFAPLVDGLQWQGIDVQLRDKVHMKFVMGDEDLLWEGSLNFLSHNDTREHVRRSINRMEVKEVKKRHQLNDSQPDMNEPLRIALIERRHECGLSAADMSRQTQVARSEISRLESGKLTLMSAPFQKVLAALDLRVVLVPAFLVGPVATLITKLRAEAKRPVVGSATKGGANVGESPKIGKSATKGR